jgi:hypothetical protein
MAEFSASDAAVEGFRLARRKPGAILAWSLAQFLFSLIAGAVLVVLVGPEMQAMRQPPDPAAMSDPVQAMAYLAAVLRVNGLMLLLYLPWGAVMACGVYRAMLTPSDRGLGYLKLGRDELRMIGLALLVGLFSGAVMLGVFIVDVIIVVIVGALLTALGHTAPANGADPLSVLIGMIAGVAPFAVFVWVLVRISLAGPMTFVEKRLRLLGSWKLTRGRFWPLFGAYALATIFFFVIVMIGMPLAILVGGLISGQGFVPVGQSLWRPDSSSLQAWFTVPHLVIMALTSLYAGLCTAVLNAPAAAAWQALAQPEAPQPPSEPGREPTGPWG